MAETWPVSIPRRAALAAFDAVGGLVARPFLRKTPAEPGQIWKILVLELWHIGDVVLATPALKALRLRYPDATIKLLAKPHAAEILRGCDFVDEIIPFDFPWTVSRGKYRPSRWDRYAISDVIHRLRQEKFDLTLDCRMDLRNNLLTYAIRARRRVGFAFGGGSFLLTDAIPARPGANHKVRDWMQLVEALGSARGSRAFTRDEAGNPLAPELRVTSDEREEASAILREIGYSPGDLIVGMHPGASAREKRWPLERFARVAEYLSEKHGARILSFAGPDGYAAELGAAVPVAVVQPNLRQLMALLTCCDVFICNDSGPMHIADALGVPVVAIFSSGNPRWYGPWGRHQRVVGQGAPRGESIDVAVPDVLAAAVEQIASMLSARSALHSAVLGTSE